MTKVRPQVIEDTKNESVLWVDFNTRIGINIMYNYISDIIYYDYYRTVGRM